MVLNRGIDSTQKTKPVKTPSVPVSNDPSTLPHLSSGLRSLLKEERESAASSRNRKQASPTKLPIAAFVPSSLQSLLKDERPLAGSVTENDYARGKLSTSAYENEWWNEKPRRPRGYVKHFQPMNTSYVKKHEPPKDYGDVVTASIESFDEDDDINFQKYGEIGDGET
jgi:hypothetical protein